MQTAQKSTPNTNKTIRTTKEVLPWNDQLYKITGGLKSILHGHNHRCGEPIHVLVARQGIIKNKQINHINTMMNQKRELTDTKSCPATKIPGPQTSPKIRSIRKHHLNPGMPNNRQEAPAPTSLN